MSYDLEIFASAGLDARALRDLVGTVPQLAVGDFDEARGWCAVTRGAKARYCFTVDGPVAVDAEDVPDEVTAVLLDPTVVFNVTVEGSAAVDVPYAVRFARQLAQATEGVVLDKQTDDVWAKGVGRPARKPDRGQRANVIEFNWYALRASVDSEFGASYIARCRRLLPEALPRRFGEYEPLQAKLAETGDAGFSRAWRESTSLLFFAASSPCISGALWAGPNEQRPRLVWHMSLNVHFEPLAADAPWRSALQRFFVAIAQRLGAFFASAEVCRGLIWTGRSMNADAHSEFTIMPARVDGWMGLPPYPTWWAWYGSPYRQAAEEHLAGGQVQEHQTGILHLLAPEPLDRDELTRLVTVRRGLRRVATWAPPQLLAQVRPHDRPVRPTPLDRAAFIPAMLV